MKKTIKRIIYGLLIILGAAVIGAAIYINSLLPIITGYAAKNLCSDVFVSGREPEDVEALDLNFSLIKYTNNKIDFDEKSVTSRFLWGKSEAIYRPGFGVTLIRDMNEDELRKMAYPVGTEPGYSQDTITWPLGDLLPETTTCIDKIKLDDITKRLITENAYNGNAFAFLVVHKGIPVAEAYKPQFNERTRFLSWSMAKSFMNAMVGILVSEGKLDINQPTGLDEWKSDDRSKITLNDLLQMQSGLEWNEDYGNRSDVTLMLHSEGDMSRFAMERPVAYKAGTHWYYSSGSTNIVSNLIRRQFSSDSAYYAFADTRLFNKIGMPDAVLEVDAAGNWVGSSYLYATARDYARFGLLYLNNGIFSGERILPEGWVEYTTTSSSASEGLYGSFFWLNRSRAMPAVPEDMYSCNGHDGQYIFIIPSRELIIVVLGYSPTSKGGIDTENLIRDVLETL
jgi:hypothetical protein